MPGKCLVVFAVHLFPERAVRALHELHILGVRDGIHPPFVLHLAEFQVSVIEHGEDFLRTIRKIARHGQEAFTLLVQHMRLGAQQILEHEGIVR